MEKSLDSTDELLGNVPEDIHQVMSFMLDELDRLEGPSQAPGKTTFFYE